MGCFAGVGRKIRYAFPNRASCNLPSPRPSLTSSSTTTLKASDGCTTRNPDGEKLLNNLRCNIYPNGGALWSSKRPLRHDLASPASTAHRFKSSPLYQSRGSSGWRDNPPRPPSSYSPKSPLLIWSLPLFSPKKLGFRRRHGLPALPVLHLPGRTPSLPNSPTHRSEFLDRTSIFRTQRPISAYDAPALTRKPEEPDLDAEGVVRANGVRVWYSSFTSVDWLHDAIKDSTRLYRLRRHKSVGGRMRNATDRMMGWVIVTIVGFLTAVVAFLIVRSEQWLFDIKYGYCATGWWKARRFCCPVASERSAFNSALDGSGESCGSWVPWGDAVMGTDATQLSRLLVGRSTYAFSAVRLGHVFVSLIQSFVNFRSYSSR